MVCQEMTTRAAWTRIGPTTKATEMHNLKRQLFYADSFIHPLAVSESASELNLSKVEAASGMQCDKQPTADFDIVCIAISFTPPGPTPTKDPGFQKGGTEGGMHRHCRKCCLGIPLKAEAK